MSGSKLFSFICVALIVGIGLGLLNLFQPIIWLGFFILIFSIILLSAKENKETVILLFLFLVSGFFWANYANVSYQHSILESLNNTKQKFILTGFVVSEPEIKGERQQLVIKITRINGHPCHSSKVIMITSSSGRYFYKEKIVLQGKLKSPPIFKDFNYRNYLKRQRIYSLIYYPKILFLDKHTKNPFTLGYRAILSVKDRLRKTINKNLPSPQNILLRSLLLGDKKSLPKEIKNEFNLAGIRHIAAISGMHIIILINILMFFLLALGVSRKTAFYFIAIFILLFVTIIGFQASAIRASIMGFLAILAEAFSRQRDFFISIAFVAALMLLINPLLMLNVGFQLSFLAVLGINYLMPIILNWLKFWTKFPQLKNTFAMSLAAYFATLPILIYNFGYFSLVAPITNLFVIPILPLILGLGIIAVIIGLGLPSIAFILFLLCWFLLTYILKIAKFFSSLPFAALNIHISWMIILIIYLSLGYIIWQHQRKERFKIVKV